MKKLVVTGRDCLAGMKMAELTDIRVMDSPIVELTEIPNLKADLFIVASTHKSASGKPSLTAHSPGNFGSNKFEEGDLGGEPRQLSVAPGPYIGEAVRKFHEIREREGLAYDVSLEVTHHGPTFRLPIVFVEVGSSEKEWRDTKAIRAAVEVIEHLLDWEHEGDAAIGAGGPHYAPNFTRRVLQGENFGHICPKYALKDLDREMFSQMVERTWPPPDRVLLDWKGLSSHRARVVKMAEESCLAIEKLR